MHLHILHLLDPLLQIQALHGSYWLYSFKWDEVYFNQVVLMALIVYVVLNQVILMALVDYVVLKFYCFISAVHVV